VTRTKLIFDEKARVADWVAERVGQLSPWGGYYAMGAETNGELVAGVVFNNFTDSNATAHLAISKPTKRVLDLLDHAFLYAFSTCGLRRLTAPVEESNAKSLQVCRHIGFVPEAVMAQAGTDGQDIHLLVLWPERYFKGKKHG
jgi:RimJ/RimL family protein N-acetyltransferase